jgi:hypothetical protein
MLSRVGRLIYDTSLGLFVCRSRWLVRNLGLSSEMTIRPTRADHKSMDLITRNMNGEQSQPKFKHTIQWSRIKSVHIHAIMEPKGRRNPALICVSMEDRWDESIGSNACAVHVPYDEE